MGFFKRLDLARRIAIDAGFDDDELAALTRALRKDPALIDDLSNLISSFPHQAGETDARQRSRKPGQAARSK